ncbi:HAD family hydrolase [Paenibacillus antarcticus]|uniref:Phosphoglycolate phosphatase n=1 Tax=Paenibacillus antarcticus TaxID=253703 RepID=A0A168PSF9_9BACL|nr:HAD family hydrolase [Paenibacillus antarcticus]OAB47028.1 phosphoglycolate phosphatase [Paenibacillus antarcticus]
MQFQNILFDLDGTLTDPKLGITQAVQYALSRFDIVENDLDKLEPFIGPPLAGSFAEYYGFSELDCKKAVEYYREYFSDRGLYENEVYVGILQLLQSLINQRRMLIVATSKPTVFAERIIQHFEMTPYFTHIYGSNLDGTRSDKGEIIRAIIEDNNLDKSQTVMIGDRKHDIIGAHKNDIASIAVEYGYGSHEELTVSKPTYIVKTVEELKNHFYEEVRMN